MHFISIKLHLTFSFIFIFACVGGDKKSEQAVTEKAPKSKSREIIRQELLNESVVLDDNYNKNNFFLGNLSGTVTYSGKPSKKRSLKMDADPICSSAHRDKVYAESFILNDDGQLDNVLVYLKNVSYKGKTPKESAIIDQKGCMYSPHVFGIMKGQELIIKNSDPTMHNIHSMAKVNDQFNFAMPKVVKEKKVTFKKIEDPFYIKCDVHPWMKAWATVLDHPYFAVSDSNGNYEITGIPAGDYEVVFWHEKAKGMGGVGEYKVTINKNGETVVVTKQDHTFVRQLKLSMK